jgi:regulatory protein
VQGRVGTGTITAIETQEKRANRVNIYIDGKFALGLFDDVAHTLGLRVGQAITPDRLTEIAGEETRRRAFEAAIYLLGFRARSEHEIRDRLRRKEYENEVIEATIEKLRTGGYLDDSTFAQGWVQGRGKSRGRRALAFELRQKGIVGEVAQEALNETRTDEDEQTAAFAVAIKRVGERPSDTSREAQAKLSAYLGRRGFGWSEIRPVLSRLYNRDESEEE